MAKNVKFKMVSIDLQVVWQAKDKSLHIMDYTYYPQIDDFETVKAKATEALGTGGKPIKFVKGIKNVFVYEIPLEDIIEHFDNIEHYQVAE